LGKIFPDAKHIQVLALSRRKNTVDFPTLKSNEIVGPIHFAHIDHTTEGARTLLRDVYQTHEELRTREFQIINVWRVLDDPCNTRPLAFCDYTLTDTTNDVESCDIIRKDSIDESIHGYYNPLHKWYWLSDQRRDEVFVFRTAASEAFDLPCPLHAAVYKTFACKATPRNVVGLRVGVFF